MENTENNAEMVENNTEMVENLTEINTIDSLKTKRKYTMSDAKLEQLKIARQRASQVRKERAIERKQNLKKSKETVKEEIPEEPIEEPISETMVEDPIQDSIIEEPEIHVPSETINRLLPLKRTPKFSKNDNGIMILNF